MKKKIDSNFRHEMPFHKCRISLGSLQFLFFLSYFQRVSNSFMIKTGQYTISVSNTLVKSDGMDDRPLQNMKW